jgi:hypothetical protein
MTDLQEWESFYVIVGSSAGAALLPRYVIVVNAKEPLSGKDTAV